MTANIKLLKEYLQKNSTLEFSSVARQLLKDPSLYPPLKEDLISCITHLQYNHFNSDYYKRSKDKDILVFSGGENDHLISLLKNVIPVTDWKDFNQFLNYSYARLNNISSNNNDAKEEYFFRDKILLNDLFVHYPSLLMIDDAHEAVEIIIYTLNEKICLDYLNIDQIKIIDSNRNYKEIGIYSSYQESPIVLTRNFIYHLLSEYDNKEYALINNLTQDFDFAEAEEDDLLRFENIKNNILQYATETIPYLKLDNILPNKILSNKKKI